VKGNQLALIVALLLTMGLFSVSGTIIWLGLKQNSLPTESGNSSIPSKTVSTPQVVNITQSFDQIELKSDRNVNYTQLKAYLQAKDWAAADRETYLRLLDASGPLAQSRGMIPQSEVATFSCTDLRTVDQLWSMATNGQQGFTTQANILRAVGADYRKLYNTVGWQKLPPSNTWAFERQYNPKDRRVEFISGKTPNYVNSPPGHLPTVEVGYNLDVAFSGALKRCAF
jgi:hypothetical protein